MGRGAAPLRRLLLSLLLLPTAGTGGGGAALMVGQPEAAEELMEYRDPCKAAAFWGDIALDEDDLKLFQIDRTVDLTKHSDGNARHTSGGLGEQSFVSSENATSTDRSNKAVKKDGRQNTTLARSPKRKEYTDESGMDTHSSPRVRRATTSRAERIWPGGVIPYVIGGNFTGNKRIDGTREIGRIQKSEDTRAEECSRLK